MAKSVESQLALLRACEADPDAQDNESVLKLALRQKSCRVVEWAARIVGEQGRALLAADLIAASEPFLKDGAKKDPGCAAKIGICEALRTLGHAEAEFFLRNITLVQFEGSTDSAAELRVLCGFALLETEYPAAMRHLVDLLADPQPAARSVRQS